MGAVCCVAAKDKAIVNGSHSETLQRHVRYSPSWSFRWDNRGRVAGEETPAYCLRDGGGGHQRVEVKSGTMVETTFASHEGGPLDSFRSPSEQKSPISERNADQAISQNLVEVKESTESPSVSHQSPVKLSSLAPSVSSISASPRSSHSHLPPPNLTPSRWHHRSPGHQLLRHLSDIRIPEYKSPTFSISEEASLFAWGNESTRGSNGSSDSWSIPVFSEHMTTRRERWSFDSENSGISRDKVTRSSGRKSRSTSDDLQTCGVCTKLLTERSSWSWSSQKLISTNELAVVAVLTCGHAYHAECLEHMTPETDKYDPACPVCSSGEKRTAEKALKAELDLKARKRSRKRVVDSDLSSDIVFDHHKQSGVEERSSKMGSSTSMKSSQGKPFLKRHFSFSLKPTRLLSENQSTQRKGFFWSRSSKN
ncbi:uncharacterized protein LOC105172906 isoform X2 [Sesamum indicum]|uniref:Uncharacterized protein LOC105172906 isoform X2 n=1 Tax=Sesamum indicum TaxID=4182 RepID=A0A6I9UF34_SESIN|nr:uncharacterized protein LOC105172906 isoform X2 [Sesamum indicum]